MAFTGDVKNIILPSPKNLPTIGGLFWAGIDEEAPEDVDFDIDASGFINLGFVAEDGLEENEDRPTTSIFAWGGDLVAKPQDSYELTETFTLYEFLNADVARAAYGIDNVTVDAATSTTGTRLSILQNSDVFDMRSWLWDAYHTGGKHVMKYFPLGQLSSKDTMTTNHKTILAHRMTVSFFPDTAGNYSYTYTDDGVLDAS